MKRFCTIACSALTLWGTTPTLAAPAATEAHGDRRLVAYPWVSDSIYAIDARPGFETAIAFADSEKVENIAVGDSATWQVTPNRRANIVFVKPASLKAPTSNMTVVTDRHTYLFVLRVSREAQFMVRFHYPEPPPEPATAASAEARPKPAPAHRAEAPRLNFAWRRSGDKALLPGMIFNDSTAVYLAWPEGVALPAITEMAADGKTLGPVNTMMSGPYTMIPGEHDSLILTQGKRRASLVNLAPDLPPEVPAPEAVTPLGPATESQPVSQP